MAYAFVQQNANDNAASATTITVTLTPTAGNLLVFCATAEAGDTASIALSDNLGTSNTFTQIGTDLVTPLNQRCTWWFAANCKGGATTFTATFTASARFRTIYVAEYSGIATTSPFLNGARAVITNPGTGTDAVSSGNANATSQPALVWGFGINVFATSAPTAGTGFTSRTNAWSSATCQGRPEDKRVTATGNVAATFTATTGADEHAAGVGIFAEAAATPTVAGWEPEFPDRIPARRSVSAFSFAAAPIAPVLALVVSPLSWAPSFPDRVPPRPTPNLAIGSPVGPVTVPPAPPDAPPLSWAPSFPDQPRRARRPLNTGGEAAPAQAIPNPPAPPLSWAPTFPDRLRRARASVNTGGQFAPVATIPDPPPSTIFPLAVSADGRHLRQVDGTPFLICGDSTWSLSVNLSAADQETFLDDCVTRGITSVMFNAIEHHYSVVKSPKDVDGNLPFTLKMDGGSYTGSPNGTPAASGTQGQFSADAYANINNQAPDPTQIGSTYWDRVDALLSACLERNIAVFVWPMYLGFHGNQEGWISELVVWDAVIGAGGFTGQAFADPTKSKLWNYGAWLGARWAQYPNVIWVAGGDYGSGSQSLNAGQAAAVKSCIDGIKSQQPTALWTAHWDRPCISDDTAITGVTWDLNFAYSGDPAAEESRRAYAVSAIKPAYWGEGFYEAGLFGGSAPFRKYLYWGFLGSIGGGFFGHEQLWRFDDGSPGTLWSTLLATQGRLDAARQYAFFQARPWHRLVPNGLGGIGTLITAGGGTASPQSTDYVAAAATPEKDLLLAYVPPAHTGSVTVDMTKLGATVTARWFDPTNATFTAIGTFPNTGTQAFTTPGNNSAGDADWLLVLEAPDAPMPLSWRPTFPDRTIRRSLSTAQIASGCVQPVATLPNPATIANWLPSFPDRTARARHPLNTGGAFAPVATLPDPGPLSWAPSFPDRALRARQPVPAGPQDPPVVLVIADVPPLSWAPVFPNTASRARQPVNQGGASAPSLAPPDPAPLSWAPKFPDTLRRRMSAPPGGETAPVATIANPDAPPLSWSPSFPDRTVRPRHSVNVGGSFAPTATIPNPPPPPLSWAPTFPAALSRARVVVLVGGMAIPDAVLPDPPTPTPGPGAGGFAGLVAEMDDLIIEHLADFAEPVAEMDDLVIEHLG